MTTHRDEKREPAVQRLLHLLTLSAFAVAQPVLDLISKNVPFLIFHGAGEREVYLLAAGLLLAPPLAFWLLELAAGKLHRTLGRAVATGATALLVVLFALPVMKKLGVSKSLFLFPLAVAVAYVFARFYARSRALRSFLAVLSPAAVVFLVSFVGNPSVRSLFASPEAPALESPPDAASVPVPERPADAPAGTSLVVVVFDSLPLVSLLDAEHRIDAAVFPNLAALASEATWFRNASTMWSFTTSSLVTMLTGNAELSKETPTIAEHPGNLFTLLAPTHELHVFEKMTQLAPPGIASGRGDDPEEEPPPEARAADSSGLLTDLGIIYLHVVGPAELTRRLPPVNQTWGGFRAKTVRRFGVITQANERIEDRRTGELLHADHRGRLFAEFLELLRPRERPQLYFFHSLLPHLPLRFLPSGKLYGSRPTSLIHPGRAWVEDEKYALEIYQRHLFQVCYVDRLVGDLVARMKEQGIYDSHALVIVADHGASYWFGQPRRIAAETLHPQDVLRIPALIKAPDQRQGALNDRNFQSIDLLPTVADAIGVEVPWETEGRSVLDDASPEPAEKVLADSDGRSVTFPGAWHLDEASLLRKLELFDWSHGEEGLYRIGGYRDLVGRPVAELPVEGAAPCELDFDQKEYVAPYVPEDDGYLPARLSGRIACEGMASEKIALGLALHGTVGAVPTVRLNENGMGLFSGFVSESLVRPGENPVEFLLVRGTPEEPSLSRVTVR